MNQTQKLYQKIPSALQVTEVYRVPNGEFYIARDRKTGQYILFLKKPEGYQKICGGANPVVLEKKAKTFRGGG